jgi:polyphenol oxidase
MTAPHLRECRTGELVWLAAEGTGWRLAFSTRRGGVSEGPFESLNIGLSVGDDPAVVLQNRARFIAAQGFDLDDLIVPGQVHGVVARVVDAGDRGRGARSRDTVISATDALLTPTPGLPLMVSFADCVPVFLAAQTEGGGAAVALAHAGWRGMLAGVLTETAAALSRIGRLTAAVVGPSIGPCCFAVGGEVGSALEARFPGVWRDGHVDLWACAAQELASAGLPAAALTDPRLCTSCDRRFYSHRRDHGITGRQAAVAWVVADGDKPAVRGPRRAGENT